MNMYNLPDTNIKEVKEKTLSIFKSRTFWGILCLVIAGCIIGFSAGIFALRYIPSQTQAFLQYFKMPSLWRQIHQDQAVLF